MDKWDELRRQIRRRVEREEEDAHVAADCQCWRAQHKHLVTATALLDVVILMDVLEESGE